MSQLSLFEKDAPREAVSGLDNDIFRLVELPEGITLLACQQEPEAQDGADLPERKKITYSNQ